MAESCRNVNNEARQTNSFHSHPSKTKSMFVYGLMPWRLNYLGCQWRKAPFGKLSLSISSSKKSNRPERRRGGILRYQTVNMPRKLKPRCAHGKANRTTARTVRAELQATPTIRNHRASE
jgi:hypothetical protein